MNLLLTTLIACLITLALFFSLGWYISFRTKLFSWIDFLWSSSFLVVLFIYHVTSYLIDQEISFRFIDLLYGVWSIRLSYHLFKRIKKHGEDSRYVKLKQKWKVWYGLNFFILFQVEAFLTIILSIPLFLTYDETFSALKWVSVIVFILAILGETISDLQLKRFIEKSNDRKKVCDVGLWKYSRHPNYFFEWLTWISFALYGLSSMEIWPALIPPLIMFLLLTKVTGIPPAEESSLQSKGENYMNYQKRTNAFFPWPPQIMIIAFVILAGFNSATSLASGVQMQQQEKIKHVFNSLRADNINILDDFYAPKTTFIDPLGSHDGIQSVKNYYKNLYANVKNIHFDFKDIVSSDNSHVLIWTMTLSADGLNQGNPVKLDGNSHIKFNEANLVIYHRDYFDMGEFIYEHIPVLGWTLKKIKDRLRGEK